MSSLRVWCLRLTGLFDKEGKDRELAEELGAHLQMHIDDNVRRGMTPEEARRDALIKLGGLEQTKERVRERRGIPFLESLLADVRFGLRMLRKSPGFTAVAVLTLAIGIGATSTIFTVLDAVLLRPLPFQDPSRLVMVWEGFPQMGVSHVGVSAPDLDFYARTQESFEGIGAFENKEFDISGDGNPERVVAARITASLFPILGVEPALGRKFVLGDDLPGRNVVLLSYSLWQRRYGGDKNILGRAVELDRETYAVVGVMPRDFRFPLPGPISNNQPADLWVPMAFTPAETQGWGMSYDNSVIARLKPGVTLAEGRTEARLLVTRLMALYPPAVIRAFGGGRVEIGLYPLREEVVGQVRPLLLVLMTAVSFVLMVACANVATLLLSRAAVRRDEIKLRTTLGATRARILGQLSTESLLLATAGGALGFLLALSGDRLLISLVPPDLPVPTSLPIGVRAVAFVAGISFLTVFLSGVAPAFQGLAISPRRPVWEGTRSATRGRAHHRLQGIFVAAEFALALILLIGSGLLIRSLANLMQTNPGFRPDHVLTLNLTLSYQAYPKASQVREFYQQFLKRLEGFPGVAFAGFSDDLPLENKDVEVFEIDGQGPTGMSNPIAATWVLGDYFQATGVSLLRGRWFTPEDQATSQPVAVISHALAKRFWPNENAIGKRIGWGPGPQPRWRTVVGIVGDVNDRILGRPIPAHVYMSYLQVPDDAPRRSMNLAVRTQQDPASMASVVVAQIHSLDPDLAAAHIRTLDQVVSSTFARPKFSAWLLGMFAFAALLLATVGIYGVLAYAVAERTREIGIRTALGAQKGAVLRMVVTDGMKLVLIGSAIGIVGALLLTRFLTSQLFGVKPTDPLTFAAVALLLAVVALLACYIPARRAAKVDPMVALRYE